jgi:hypothetical protein
MGDVTQLLRGTTRKRRRKTREEALAASSLMLVDIATIAEVTKNAAARWRGAHLKEKDAAQMEGREPVYDDNCLLPADDETETWDGTYWTVPRVIQWLRDTNRMARDSYETHRKPGAGRPRKHARPDSELRQAA